MIFYVFLDGVGITNYDPNTNPFSRYAKGFLAPLGGISKEDLDLPIAASNIHYLKTDAHMGVPGLPQSATGQTALWTGIPGPKVLGRHVSGFPTITLRKIIAKYSMIKVLNENGILSDFLNCFSPPYLKHVEEKPKLVSASTLVQLASGRPLKNFEDLRGERGLYMDLTHEIMGTLGIDMLKSGDPLLEKRDPYLLGTKCFQRFSHYQLTLYEYFLTDKVGHAMDWEKAEKVIHNLELFFKGLLTTMDPKKDLLIVSSDHGNMEDLSQKNHTENPAATILYGKDADRFAENIHSLADIVPEVYKTFGLEEALHNTHTNEFLMETN
ncbi:metalloenzyme domain protein [Leptospira yanagawae serovar Saopaulo str. Sao Paulo = ATCC 700523]|uniref:Metalloenzyme domain protein n=1 Tax=Leptospira yanagawae serovar Saopaulo str. Sao Paulo = ATCC 700523 TaxID=1249483 RepID=A0A5E8HA78_9LEPT|nr:metalloenzyme domain protein [Leptospira yanagawae]EOQ87657.1 metalloenzyme domain protein [Leptospira yanagawae serovar Saopaulo str. Sao Paulo = ATCC 700523]